MLDNIQFVIRQKNFKSEFIKNVSLKQNQDLFAYLMTVIPGVIFSKLEKFTIRDFPLDVISINVKVLANIRIDIAGICAYLEDISKNPNCKLVNTQVIISELILFVFQYTFIELSKNIVASKTDDKEYFFNIKSAAEKNSRYIATLENRKKISDDRKEGMKNFIAAYSNSFETSDKNEITNIEEDLILMSITSNQKKRLHSCFASNIIFEDNLSSTKKNALLIYLFKNVTAKFFYKSLEDYELKDSDVLENYRQFLKRHKT